ncbi:uncharacterized protein K452DRAFT_29005 [Aplosporella prunicola CBS 121167]|uniref:Uncharacterized protein n=1 Tax=Aplosporella prunicola CBS 121167 TaxID=1176127 RepID=A0A6A6BDV8_9PEZI|nr:uncharacterized protein K452DRAFT_29005 [Aplosporella prunicola CBS 121167]KAF2142256.1 hypothetical protein K452DRAFT_29005 [Aplosporella prunicola CBS 121167]
MSPPLLLRRRKLWKNKLTLFAWSLTLLSPTRFLCFFAHKPLAIFVNLLPPTIPPPYFNLFDLRHLPRPLLQHCTTSRSSCTRTSTSAHTGPRTRTGYSTITYTTSRFNDDGLLEGLAWAAIAFLPTVALVVVLTAGGCQVPTRVTLDFRTNDTAVPFNDIWKHYASLSADSGLLSGTSNCLHLLTDTLLVPLLILQQEVVP